MVATGPANFKQPVCGVCMAHPKCLQLSLEHRVLSTYCFHFWALGPFLGNSRPPVSSLLPRTC